MQWYTLVVYEYNPEYTKFFLIPESDLSETDRTMLEVCKGRFLNCENEGEEYECAQLRRLSDMVTEEQKYCQLPEASHNCAWVQYEVKEQPICPPECGGISKVYYTGFAL